MVEPFRGLLMGLFFMTVGMGMDAREVLEAHFRGASLDGLGVGGLTAGLQAAGAAVAYVRETQGDSLAHLSRVQRLVTGEAMLLDPTAVATLELFETAQERSARGSLFATLDRASTPMGRRLLRQWLLRPLLDREAVERRQEAIGRLMAEPALRAALGKRLEHVGGLERLTSRAALGGAHATHPESEHDVLRDREVREERVGLEDHGQLALGRRAIRHVLAADHDPAARGLLEACDEPQRGGLATARGTQEDQHLAGGRLEADVVHRAGRAPDPAYVTD